MPKDLNVLTSIYAENDSLGKSIIISLVDHQKYTKDDIMKTFNFSRCIVDKSRKLRPEFVGLVIPEKTKQSRIHCVGMNGFSTLAAESIKRMDLAKDLETGKCYLEAKILNKCNGSSTLPTHSTSFALSDESDLALQQPHYSSLSEECGDCYLLLSSLSEIDKQAAEHGNPDLVYDVQVAIADVVAYMKHQIRDAQQKQVKAVAINLLDEESAFWLKDYCQKVLPSKFREGQKEYFGKK